MTHTGISEDLRELLVAGQVVENVALVHTRRSQNITARVKGKRSSSSSVGTNLSNLRAVLEHLDRARRRRNNGLVAVPGACSDAAPRLQRLNHLLL